MPSSPGRSFHRAGDSPKAKGFPHTNAAINLAVMPGSLNRVLANIIQLADPPTIFITWMALCELATGRPRSAENISITGPGL
ncbi:MAG: hypothetical protein R3A44_39185 [Caldilineaceae bacterium]